MRHQGLEPRTNWLRVNCSTNWANGACDLYVTKKGHIMASIYSRIDKKKNKKYYCSIYHNGKRTRKSLGCSKQSAKVVFKKLEYKLLFNVHTSKTKPQIPCYEKAILSFLKEVKRTSVKLNRFQIFAPSWITSKTIVFQLELVSLIRLIETIPIPILLIVVKQNLHPLH